MHVDLFNAGHSRDEVYRAMCQHQVRDRAVLRVLDVVTVAAFVGALTDFNGWRVVLWVVAAIAGTSAIRHFVDMSNRNFLMHRLDWERETAAEQAPITTGN